MIKVKVFTNSLKNSMNKREKFKFIPKGYLEVEEFDKDEAWNLLNWSNYAKEQPKETLNTEVSTCCSGILLQEEGQDECYLSLSVGWKRFTNFEEAFRWMRPRARKNFLIDGDII